MTEVFSVKAAQAYLRQHGLSMSPRQIYHMSYTKRWPFYHIGGLRKLVIRREHLDDILAGRTPVVAAPPAEDTP